MLSGFPTRFLYRHIEISVQLWRLIFTTGAPTDFWHLYPNYGHLPPCTATKILPKEFWRRESATYDSHFCFFPHLFLSGFSLFEKYASNYFNILIHKTNFCNPDSDITVAMVISVQYEFFNYADHIIRNDQTRHSQLHMLLINSNYKI